MIGETISHYRILDKLGEGGMGVVYKAMDVRLNRLVALKFMPGQAQLHEDDRRRFMQEAQSAAVLNHPNVCTIHDVVDEGERRFIVMELVDGQTLRSAIYGSQGQKLDEPAAIGIACQIGDALAEAHRHEIVHRDVKADNIMVNPRGQVKVMDFGLAKLKGSMKLTRVSSTLGTLSYMSPEQLRGEEVDARSDIFSFGVLLFEMLTGRMPFRGEHEAAMMYTIMNEAPDAVSKYSPDVSPELERIIERSLEKDPADRYQHIDDLVSELRRLQKKSGRVERPGLSARAVPSSQERPVEARPASIEGGPKKNRGILTLTALAVIAGVAVAAIWFSLTSGDGPKIESVAVLPFVNTAGDPEIEYLTEGLTDYLTNNLAQVPGLRVLPSSFTAKYRNLEIQPDRIGNELNVGAVLTGRVTRRGDRLIIQAELIDVSRVSQLWGERYDRELGGVQQLQADVVSKVSARLGVALDPKGTANLVKGSTTNADAYQAWLKGRYEWNKRTVAGARNALVNFQRAIDLDPAFALAYNGYAQALFFPGSEASPAAERFPKIKAAVEKALEIEPELVPARVTLAGYYGRVEHQWEKSRAGYKSALELDPDYPTALHWLAENLCLNGHFEEGLEYYRKAVSADPLSMAIATDYAWGHYFAGKYDTAASMLEAIVRTEPSYERTYDYLFSVYLSMGRQDLARETMRRRAEQFGGGAGTPAAVDSAWRADGIGGVVGLRLREYRATLSWPEPEYTLIGEMFLLMGKRDSALTYLRKGIESYDIWTFFLAVKPTLDTLRGEPEFREAIRRMNYVEAEARALAGRANREKSLH